MKQKNATPIRERAETLLKNILRRLEWKVVLDLDNSMIVRNRFTGEFKAIDK